MQSMEGGREAGAAAGHRPWPAPTSPATVPTALAALRHRTKALHERLDAGTPLSRPQPTLADYVDHLRVLRRWLLACSAALETLTPGFAGRLLERLDADLAAAGVDAGGAEALAPLPSEGAAAWGVAYVVRGSQLGGQALARRLASALAPHPLHYLHGAGVATGSEWRAFVQALDAGVTGAGIASACDAAAQAFDALLRAFGGGTTA